MKVVKVDVIRIDEAIVLPEPWSAAWWEPSGKPRTTLGFSIYRLTTDEGLVGIGPYTGGDPHLAIGQDPFEVGCFWARTMSGVRSETSGKGASGLEIALWDLDGQGHGTATPPAAGQSSRPRVGLRHEPPTAYGSPGR